MRDEQDSESADWLQGCKHLHMTGKAGSRVRVRINRKEVSDRKATVLVFTHQPLHEARDTGQMGSGQRWLGGGWLPTTERDWQMALPAAEGLSPVCLHTLGAMG